MTACVCLNVSVVLNCWVELGAGDIHMFGMQTQA